MLLAEVLTPRMNLGAYGNLLRFDNVTLQGYGNIIEGQLQAACGNGLASDLGQAEAAWDLHMDNGQAIEAVLPEDRGKLIDVEIGVVELGTTDNDTMTSEKATMEIAHCKRYAISDHEQIGTFMIAPGFRTSFGGSFGMISGAIAANGVTFHGNAGGTINGSIINYSRYPLRLSGNSDLQFNRSGLTRVPAGFVPETILHYDPASYTEMVL